MRSCFFYKNVTKLLSGSSLTTCTALFFILVIPLQSFAQHLFADDSGEGITIREGDKRVLHFQYHPKSYNGEYERAGYVHPLYGLNGEILTEDMPEDHPYHRGIFWAWHQIIKEGKKVADGWISENIFWSPGKISIEKAPGEIRLSADIYWKLIINSDTVDLVKEHTIITVYAEKEKARAIDFSISLFPLADSVSIGGAENEKGYGGFCLRLRLPSDINFNSAGINIIPQENAVKAGQWLNFTGSFAGDNMAQSGIVAIAQSEPDSKGWRWVLRSQKSMQNIVDPGNKPEQLPSAGWHRKYRLIIHDGTLCTDKINGLTDAFNNTK